MKPENKDKFYLEHILQSIDKIAQLIAESSKEEFLEDWKTQDAVVRNLEIIGEAAKNVSNSLKAEYPTVAWKSAKEMRNFLIHVYFSIDYQVVWNTVQDDLPLFKKQILACLEKLEN